MQREQARTAAARVHPRHLQEALACYRGGQLARAEAIYQDILRLDPDHADALHMMGVIAGERGQPQAAIALLQRAIGAAPRNAYFHGSLGNVYKAQGQLDSALREYQRALALKPDLAEAGNNLATVLKDLGRLDEAIDCYRQVLARKPDCTAVVYSNLLFLYGFRNLLSPAEYLEQARGWELASVPAGERQTAARRLFRPRPAAGRRLRVGYVSGDFREHPISYFVEQLFSHHDRGRVEVFAYATQHGRDAVTARLQGLVEHWLPHSGESDAALRDRIAADAIDVLIDLSGHTVHNRLGVFARRAAPVQAHYLGFFASSGLSEMDYWIGDAMMTPAQDAPHFSEQVWRLPRVSVSYSGRPDAPAPAWRPSPDGKVRLGSFNNLIKITPQTLVLWARLLKALPEAVLLLKTRQLADPGNRRRIIDSLAAQGVDEQRIELEDGSATRGWSAHMSAYDRLDIALDPIGSWGGNTTTCDALWMAVPVITLPGDRAATRMTAPMLDALGHPEWIARSEQDYIDKTVALVRDTALRSALRAQQRERMRRSPLCDAAGLAADLEEAYFAMYERYLARCGSA